jgi:hypothetical protein
MLDDSFHQFKNDREIVSDLRVDLPRAADRRW